jgi:hypothetical protein
MLRRRKKSKKRRIDLRPPHCRPFYKNIESFIVLKQTLMPSKNYKGLVDLCIQVSRRIEFTQLCFTALIQNTNWGLVKKIIIMHDIPKTLNEDTLEEDQKSREFLKKQISTLIDLGVGVSYIESQTGSVALCMKYGMRLSDAPYFLKIDNDVCVGKNYLERLFETMESYEELVVLGYSRIWNDSFQKNKIITKDGLDYGYMKCLSGYEEKQEMKYNVGGLVMVRMTQELKKQLKNFICRDVFFGWPTFQIYYLKDRLGTVGWYWPNIENLIILDFLKDKELIEAAGLDYNRLLKLVDKYYEKGYSRRSKDFALKSTQKMDDFKYLKESWSANGAVINKKKRLRGWV